MKIWNECSVLFSVLINLFKDLGKSQQEPNGNIVPSSSTMI